MQSIIHLHSLNSFIFRQQVKRKFEFPVQKSLLWNFRAKSNRSLSTTTLLLWPFFPGTLLNLSLNYRLRRCSSISFTYNNEFLDLRLRSLVNFTRRPLPFPSSPSYRLVRRFLLPDPFT